jgi:hypothetical protein
MSLARGQLEIEFNVEWVPVRAAAKTLMVSRQRVEQLCESGVLECMVYEGTRLVSIRSVAARAEARRRSAVRDGARR